VSTKDTSADKTLFNSLIAAADDSGKDLTGLNAYLAATSVPNASMRVVLTVRLTRLRRPMRPMRRTRPTASNAANLGGSPPSAYRSSVLWARVAPTGTLTDGSGTVSASRTGTGNYQVVFNRSVVKCAYEATIGSSLESNGNWNDNGPGQIFTEPRSGNPNAVFVATTASGSATSADNCFHLAVIC
jgi:hypothetical protein